MAAALLIGLIFCAAFLVEHSLKGALNAVKIALKGEFSTDTGTLNLVGMVLMVFVFLFSNLHETVTNVLSVEKPAPAQNQVLAPVVLFGLGFVGSLICVLLVERKSK
jgi:hypothetical protein